MKNNKPEKTIKIIGVIKIEKIKNIWTKNKFI
jgi:hypothetical protein